MGRDETRACAVASRAVHCRGSAGADNSDALSRPAVAGVVAVAAQWA